jgi:hypothetical protein
MIGATRESASRAPGVKPDQCAEFFRPAGFGRAESDARLLARSMQPARGDVGAPVGTASPDRRADAANLVGITCRQHAARATGAHVPVLRKLSG